MKYFFLFPILGLISFFAKSQTPFCGSDWSPADPAAQARHEQLEQQAYAFFSGHPPAVPDGSNAPLTVSVVVHIIHNNGTENISDAQVQQGLAWLNSAYSNTSYFDQGSGTDVGIQFCLAQLDPNGQPTTGITRNQNSLTNMTQETQDGALKNLNFWDSKSYLNIWLVREICSTTVGCAIVAYAYGPSFHGTGIDGLVIESQFFGSVQSQTSVAAHELGHYFGLLHTFEGGCQNDNCLMDGDKVCDTPPDNSTAAVACGAIVNTCSTDAQSGFSSDQPDMTSNFMDYGDINCFHDFTPGQAARMNFFLNGTRHSLLEANGCSMPCTAPVVSDFTASATLITGGQVVTFTNNSQNAGSYQWSINGTVFSSATNATYVFTTPGTYTVTLQAVANQPAVCGSATNQVVVHVVCAVLPPVQAEICPGQHFFYQGQVVPPDTTLSFLVPGSPCDSLVHVHVSVFPPVMIQLPVDTVLPTGISLPLPVTVSGASPLSYAWQPGTRLSCTDCLQPIATTLDSITYTLQVTDANGCTATGSIALLVDPDCQLLIPNAFTPNGDGINDWFYPAADPCVRTVRLWRVVNRWGQIVFERSNFAPNQENLGWDGRWQGKAAASDVLGWQAELEYYDGRVERRKGEVLLLR